MTTKSYTSDVASRTDLQKARRYEFVPVPPPEETPEEALVAAEKLMSSLRELDDKMKHGFGLQLSTIGADEMKKYVLASKVGGESFKAMISDEMDKLGWRTLCEELVAAFESADANKPIEGAGASGKQQEGGGGEKSEQNISKTKGSATAEGTALLRFIANLYGFGPDGLAHLMCDANQQKMFVASKSNYDQSGKLLGGTDEDGSRRAKEPWNVTMCPLTFMHNRTCFGDDAMRQFSSDYPDGSIVLLGAGYDTRFYRLEFPETMQLFEVDTSATQAAKKEKLAVSETAQRAMSKVRYVDCDFERQSWFDRLVEGGSFVPDRATLLILEGVSQYLPQEVFESILEVMVERMKGPAAIAFDYFSPQLIEKAKAVMTKVGEPHIFGLEPDVMASVVESKKLHVIDHLGMSECSQRYLPTLGGEPLGLATDHKCLIIAGNEAFLKR